MYYPEALNNYYVGEKCTNSLHSHDDITYQSLANAFSLPLVLNEPSFERMKRLMRAHPSQPNFDWEDKNNPALAARLRMVTLPWDESRPGESQALFPSDDLWVPVAVVNGNIYVLPGVPKLCIYSPFSSLFID